MAWKWYNSKVIDIKDESSTTKRFWVKVEDALDFTPGQFVTMDLPISDKRLKRWRSYSIANHSDGTDVLEFCIVNLEGGAASEYFFNSVDLGTTIKFKGPSGTFTLPKKIEEDLVLICTGTGVAPYRSMINHILNNDVQHKNIHLIFGTRFEEGILYREEFEQIAKNHDWFSFDIALSREESWKGYKGYIHEIYMEKYKNNTANKRFYICGWSQMIDEAVANLLLKLKVDKSYIHYELYG